MKIEFIEREAALALLKDDREVCADSKEELKYIREDIRSIPAADVRPVVRGFWVEENGEDAHTGELWCIWKCSECGARRTAGWRHTQEGRKPRNNFCPNCGADMREESRWKVQSVKVKVQRRKN